MEVGVGVGVALVELPVSPVMHQRPLVGMCPHLPPVVAMCTQLPQVAVMHHSPPTPTCEVFISILQPADLIYIIDVKDVKGVAGGTLGVRVGKVQRGRL